MNSNYSYDYQVYSRLTTAIQEYFSKIFKIKKEFNKMPEEFQDELNDLLDQQTTILDDFVRIMLERASALEIECKQVMSEVNKNEQ